MMYRVQKIVQKTQNSAIAKGALWMAIAYALRLGIQAGYFIIVARLLGAEQYGELASILSLVAIAFPFSGLGSGEIMLRNATRDVSTFAESWGDALWITAVSSFLLTALLMGLGHLFLPSGASLSSLVATAIADLFCFRVVAISWQAFMAFSKMKETAYLNLVPSLLRFLAAIAFAFLFTNRDLEIWSYLYLIATAAAAGLSVEMVWQRFGKPQFSGKIARSQLWDGLHFSIGLSAQSIYNDIDKILLSRMVTLEITGIYAAAYRIIDVAFVPIRSVLASSFAKFFQNGANGIIGTWGFAKKMLPMVVLVGLVSSLALLIGSGVLPIFLGQEYAASVEVIQWLCLLPLIKSAHYFGGDTLMGANFQNIRSVIQIGIALLNLVLNFWLIPLYSWRGAAIVSLISDGLLLVSLWLAVALLYRRQKRQEARL